MIDVSNSSNPTPELDVHEHAIEPDVAIVYTQTTMTEQGALSKNVQVSEKKQMMMILAGFVLLPLIIIGGLLLFRRVANSRGSEEIATATPSVTQAARPTEAEEEEEDEDVTPTLQPSPTGKKTTGTPTPKISATPARTPTLTQAAKLSNLYFHSANCTYPEGSSGAAVRPMQPLNGKEFTTSNVPDSILCTYVIQNSEEVETSEFKYVVTQNGTTIKQEDVGTLKKGNYPNSEYKSGEATLTPVSSAGTHRIKIELNPDKKFSESNTGDNVFEVSYTVN